MAMQEWFQSKDAYRGPGIRDGADVERGLCGAPKIPQNERITAYMPYQQALDYVRKYPPTEIPKTIKDLREQVAKLCRLSAHQVRYFSAVGTPLDTLHGVDAFFEAFGRVATIDISLREKEGWKADTLLHAIPTANGVGYEVSAKEMSYAASVLSRKLLGQNVQKAA